MNFRRARGFLRVFFAGEIDPPQFSQFLPVRMLVTILATFRFMKNPLVTMRELLYDG